MPAPTLQYADRTTPGTTINRPWCKVVGRVAAILAYLLPLASYIRIKVGVGSELLSFWPGMGAVIALGFAYLMFSLAVTTRGERILAMLLLYVAIYLTAIFLVSGPIVFTLVMVFASDREFSIGGTLAVQLVIATTALLVSTFLIQPSSEGET